MGLRRIFVLTALALLLIGANPWVAVPVLPLVGIPLTTSAAIVCLVYVVVISISMC